MRGLSTWGLIVVLSAPAGAAAQDNSGWVSDAEVEANLRAKAPFAGTRLGVDLMEPTGTSRIQLLSRGIFSDGDRVFSDQAAWSAEARFHLRLIDEVGITGVLPFGIVNPGPGDTRFFIGNVALGVAGGSEVDLVDPVASPTPIRLRIGAGIDFYLPTAPTGNDLTVAAESLVAAIRAYEPQLFVPDLFSVRFRGQASLSLGELTAGLELNLVPGGLVKGAREGLLLIGGAARVSYKVTPIVEPFFEMGATTQVAGEGQIRPPFMLTPGVRLHVTEHLSPAFFVSANLVSSKALIFGFDLAAAMPKPSPKEKRRSLEVPEDFLDGF